MSRSFDEARSPRAPRTPDAAPGPRQGGRADRLLALQRRAGNAAVGALLRRERQTLARCAGGECHCGKCSQEEELEEELDGKGWTAEPDLAEELEGKARVATLARRKLQRLSIKQHKFHQGKCGERNVQWVFSLDKAAPADGYIVQHITASELIGSCPGPVKGTPSVTKEFWEAWLVKKGDTVDWTTTRDKWTDGSTRPANPSSNGMQRSDGNLKFFLKSKTGDLGDFGVAPADPKSDWGPGKVPTSGALPSTAKKPSWWDDTPTEGPVVRFAQSNWDCCDSDASKHTSTVTATK